MLDKQKYNMVNSWGSTLMMRYKNVPPYRRSKKCRKGSFKHGRTCQQCCLLTSPTGFRRCYNQCSTSGFGSRRKALKNLVPGKIKTSGRRISRRASDKLRSVRSNIRSVEKEMKNLRKGMEALMRRAELGRVGMESVKQMNTLHSRHSKLDRRMQTLQNRAAELRTVVTTRNTRFGIKGALTLKNKLKLATQKRRIAARKIREIVDKPLQFIGRDKIKPLPHAVKETEALERWGEIYKRENKKVAALTKTIKNLPNSPSRNRRANKFGKKTTTRPSSSRRKNIPPPLRKVPTGGKRLRYTLSKSAVERRKALTAGINSEMRKRGISKEKAAQAKKGRLNVLRIYRRNSKPAECRKITMDMRWIDRTYLRSIKGKTSKIC